MTPQQSSPSAYSSERKLRLAYFVSHPIQYQAPLLRRIAKEPDIDLKVFFSSDISVRGYMDQGFGVAVKWDVPLVDGYAHEFLPILGKSERVSFWEPINHGIKKALGKGHFDAAWIHGYSTFTTMRAILAAGSLKIPVLLRAESTLSDRPRSRKTKLVKDVLFRILRKRVSATLAIGDDNRDYWKHYFGEQFPQFPFYYCVDNDYFQERCSEASKTREEFRKSLGLEAGRPVILYASKLQTRKHCNDLLAAVLEMSKSSTPGRRPYLLIVGDGEERANLEAQAKAASPGDVRFLGFRNQSELPRFYDLCSVFVLPSVYEPWGLVVNEVMNAGRAIIVTHEVGCQKNLVQHGVNGCVYQSRNVSALTECLRTVLTDEETSERMGAESLRIIRSFGFEQNVSGLRQALAHIAPGFAAVSVE